MKKKLKIKSQWCFFSWQTDFFKKFCGFYHLLCTVFTQATYYLVSLYYILWIFFYSLSYLHIHIYALFLNTLFLTFLIFLSIFLPSISWPFVVTHNICLEYSNANFNCYISSQILSGTKVSPKILVFQYFQENFKIMLFLWNAFIYLQLILIFKNDGNIIIFMNYLIYTKYSQKR